MPGEDPVTVAAGGVLADAVVMPDCPHPQHHHSHAQQQRQGREDLEQAATHADILPTAHEKAAPRGAARSSAAGHHAASFGGVFSVANCDSLGVESNSQRNMNCNE